MVKAIMTKEGNVLIKDFIKLYHKEGMGAVFLIFFLWQFHLLFSSQREVNYLTLEKLEKMRDVQHEHDIKLVKANLVLDVHDFRIGRLEED